jgi:hypothetical protein
MNPFVFFVLRFVVLISVVDVLNFTDLKQVLAWWGFYSCICTSEAAAVYFA